MRVARFLLASVALLVWAMVMGLDSVLAREFNVITFVSMTIQGRPIANNEVAASYAAMVIAVKHFNERNSSVLHVMSRLGSCDAKLNLYGGLFDDQVLASVAMSYLIDSLGKTRIDFINGPLGSDVSFTTPMACVCVCACAV